MELTKRPRAHDGGLPEGCADRLAQFAIERQVRAFPPEQVLEDQGDGLTFSTPFLRWCQETDMSLDWFYFGTGQPVAMREYRA
ncbi:hypothetical protein MU516_12980 [Paracoccus sp. YLB-12]|uniref:Uncharacterized protein n=1 Tax=Paracoccus maritimus TaxID=2933292 RepID=A0ABT2KBZ6_9RHOB|nr:hypothetical protein [Paracoccus sp. YLB-12]MCT4333778.1 hypothetical protein [Paracoccus sp. YLB-12]